MIDLTKGLLRLDQTLNAPRNNRLPWVLQCIGPRDVGVGIFDGPPVMWEGVVLSDGVPCTGPVCARPSIQLSTTVNGNSTTVVWDEFPEDTVLLSCSIALDVNGRPTVSYSTVEGAFLIFFNDASLVWEVLSLGPLSYSPVVALDGFAPVHGDVDVVCSYLSDNNGSLDLVVLYQRERYATPHIVYAGLSPSMRLRTAGTTAGGRFEWRFERRVVL